MRKFRTEQRLQKIERAASFRQPTLTVVLENIHDPHNVSAIFRTCDAVGVQKINMVYTVESFPKVSRISSASANKWVEVQKYNNVESCVEELVKSGFKIYVSMLDENAVNLYDLDLTEPCAIVLGNEHRGVSEEFQKLADKTFYIPMRGMIQSLNVSVAAAVSLYEAQRQRSVKGMYDKSNYSDEELNSLIDGWCRR